MWIMPLGSHTLPPGILPDPGIAECCGRCHVTRNQPLKPMRPELDQRVPIDPRRIDVGTVSRPPNSSAPCRTSAAQRMEM